MCSVAIRPPNFLLLCSNAKALRQFCSRNLATRTLVTPTLPRDTPVQRPEAEEDSTATHCAASATPSADKDVQQESMALLEWPSLCRQVAAFASTPLGARRIMLSGLPIGRSKVRACNLLYLGACRNSVASSSKVLCCYAQDVPWQTYLICLLRTTKWPIMLADATLMANTFDRCCCSDAPSELSDASRINTLQEPSTSMPGSHESSHIQDHFYQVIYAGIDSLAFSPILLENVSACSPPLAFPQEESEELLQQTAEALEVQLKFGTAYDLRPAVKAVGEGGMLNARQLNAVAITLQTAAALKEQVGGGGGAGAVGTLSGGYWCRQMWRIS